MVTKRTPAALLVLALSSAAYLGACSREEPALQDESKPTAAQTLVTLKGSVDTAPYVRMDLTGKDVPADAEGVLAAKGHGAHPPAFKGTFTARVKGIQADIDVIATGGKVYAKLPLLPGMREVNPKDLGTPDPAGLFNPDSGITTLLTATKDPTFGDQTRRGADVLNTIKGTLPGDKIVNIFWTGEPAKDFQVTYGYVESSGELRTVELTGPFFGGRTSSYALTLDQYGQTVDIKAP